MSKYATIIFIIIFALVIATLSVQVITYRQVVSTCEGKTEIIVPVIPSVSPVLSPVVKQATPTASLPVKKQVRLSPTPTRDPLQANK